MRELLATAVIVSLLFIVAGCSGANSQAKLKPEQPPVAAGQAAGSQEKYVLQPGDLVDVKFYYNPELNEEVRIRPDGVLTVQLIDEVAAAGLTPGELKKLLVDRYSSILKSPEVTVIVKEFSSNKVYVGGEVQFPGLVPLNGRMTSLQAIFHAGGVKDSANLRSVVILRNSGSGNPEFITIDLKKSLDAESADNDIVLNPYDVVFVPKTTIAKMNQFVDQYYTKLIPINLGFGFSYIYNLRPEVQVR